MDRRYWWLISAVAIVVAQVSFLPHSKFGTPIGPLSTPTTLVSIACFAIWLYLVLMFETPQRRAWNILCVPVAASAGYVLYVVAIAFVLGTWAVLRMI